MKLACALLCALLTVGCAAKRPAKPYATIPLSCISKLDQAHARCRQISDSLAECDGVMVSFACVRYPGTSTK